MSRGRPTKITKEIRTRLEREADIIAQHTPYKKLAAELGLTSQYISNFISRTLQSRINVRKASNKDE